MDVPSSGVVAGDLLTDCDVRIHSWCLSYHSWRAVMYNAFYIWSSLSSLSLSPWPSETFYLILFSFLYMRTLWRYGRLQSQHPCCHLTWQRKHKHVTWPDGGCKRNFHFLIWVSRYKDEVKLWNGKSNIFEKLSSRGIQSNYDIRNVETRTTFEKGLNFQLVGAGPWPGICQKKAYISKTIEPNLKNDYVLESAWTGAST